MTLRSPPQTILITGASQGLGAALARYRAAPGVRLILIARNVDRLAAVAAACRNLGAETETGLLDVRDTAALARFIEAADARWPIDAVYANAGIEASLGPDGAPEALATVLDQFHTNLDGVAATVAPLLPAMRVRGRGTVVLVSSLAALVPLPDQPAYCASKAAVLAWGEALAPSLAGFGVRVVLVCPGFIATGMSDHYQGWRPLEWSADKAARHICRALDRGRTRILFPTALAILTRLGRSTPASLRGFVIGRFFRFSIGPQPPADFTQP